MNISIIIGVGFGLVGFMGASIACEPTWLGDSNKFLANFINHEYLNVLGVILAITLASLAQIHLSLNAIEERRNIRLPAGVRAEIRSAARWLIGGFVAALFLVWLKPLLPAVERSTAIVNSAALLLLGFYVLILIDITHSVFDIGPDIDADEPSG
jgi:hypothetical protein